MEHNWPDKQSGEEKSSGRSESSKYHVQKYDKSLVLVKEPCGLICLTSQKLKDVFFLDVNMELD